MNFHSQTAKRLSPVKRWEKYWFRPAPLFNLAVCRILFAGFQLFYLQWRTFPSGFRSLSELPDGLYAPLPVLQSLLLPLGVERPGLEILMAVYALTFASGVFAFLGLLTNPALLLFTAGNIFMQAYMYSYHNFHHPEGAMMIALAFLALSPCGRALSVDRWISRRGPGPLGEKSVYARWPLLAVQWLLAVIYAASVKSKWEIGGPEWLNGFTIQWHLFQDGFGKDILWALAFGHYHLMAVIMSWTTVVFEATFFLAVLFPALRFLYVPLGLIFHTGIYLTLKAAFFQFVILYAAFPDWTRLVKSLRRPHASAFARPRRPEHPQPALFRAIRPVLVRASSAAFVLWACLLVSEAGFRFFLSDPRVPVTEQQFHTIIEASWPRGVALEKRPGTFRILALADSFGTFGGTKNYHYVLEEILRRRGIKAEIVNLSLPALEPADELAMLRRWGLRYQPDLILHGFFVGTDFNHPHGTLVGYGGILFRDMMRFNALDPKTFFLYHWLKHYRAFRSEQARLRSETWEEAQEEAFWNLCALPAHRHTWDNTFKVLDAIRVKADSKGVNYALVIHPERFQVERSQVAAVLGKRQKPVAYDLELPQKHLRDYCRRQKIACLDLLPEFEGRGGLFMRRDAHYNEAANALAAEAIARFLTQERLLPSSISPRPEEAPVLMPGAAQKQTLGTPAPLEVK